MTDKYIIAGIMIFVLICWAIFVMVWRGNQRQLAEWRKYIKKGDQCYFINTLGEKSYVTVLAVDRSRPRDVQIELILGGHKSEHWVEAAQLFPNYKREDN